MKISDIVLVSDVDGTLLPYHASLPARNVQALQRFTQGGGRFAIATGRAAMFAREIVPLVPINFPCVVYNGGGVYDFTAEEYLYEEFLPKAFLEYIQEIMEAFPQVHYSVVNREHYFDVTEDEAVTRHYQYGKFNPYLRKAKLSELQGDFCKVVTLVDPEYIPQVMAFTKDRYPGLRFVLTNPTMMEILPETTTKANALKHLMDIKGFRREQLVCIGDYYNDMEMISMAGLGVTLETSPVDLQEMAGLVVGPCENGAIADLIEHLEDTYGY